MIPPMWIVLKLFRVTPDGPPAILIGQENRRQTVGNVASDVAEFGWLFCRLRRENSIVWTKCRAELAQRLND